MIQDWPPLTTAKDVRSFLGLCGFYQRFIRDYAHIVTPLTDLLKKDVIWRWDTPQIQALEELKRAMCHTCRMAYPDTSRPFSVHLDASLVAIGATLSQEDKSGALRLVTCTSSKLDSAERNYTTDER